MHCKFNFVYICNTTSDKKHKLNNIQMSLICISDKVIQ